MNASDWLHLIGGAAIGMFVVLNRPSPKSIIDVAKSSGLVLLLITGVVFGTHA